MYPTVLIVHSWLRWLVIVLGLWAAASGLSAGRGRGSHRAAMLFTIALDVQLLVGVLLYVALSPITRAALTDMGAAMHNPTWRFWTVEHPALMIVAVVFGHVGRIVARRAGKGTSPSLRAPAVWYALAVVAILAAVPWPFLSHGRPLFRF